jgi:hypothetical protein
MSGYELSTGNNRQKRVFSRRDALPLVIAIAGGGKLLGLFGRSHGLSAPRAQEATSTPSAEPPWIDKLIPDASNQAWDDLGPRRLEGLVYHRLYGSLEISDNYLRSCGTDLSCNALVDFAVDNKSGEVWRWNDPQGAAHPELGVSANRAPWASGPVDKPDSDAQAFVGQNGVDAVNRDQVSISIAGMPDEPIEDAGLDAVAELSAYFANLAGIEVDSYPDMPNRNYSFVRVHNQFASTKECPGQVVIDALPEITKRTQDVLRRLQSAG